MLPELTPNLRHRIHALRRVADKCARAGLASLGWAYHHAAQSLRRGDQVSAEYWLERADCELHAFKPAA